MPVSYQIGAVSRLTGISADTLRAWERRYGAVTPKRGDERRGYDQADIERLILLRRAVEKGHSIRTVASLPDDELRRISPDRDAAVWNSAPLIESLITALEAFDYAALNETMGRLSALLSPSDIVHSVVLPLMKEVGNRWHRDELTIAQEHMMTGIVHNLLGTLLSLFRPRADAVKLLYTTLEGEMHSLGILAAAILATGTGLSPIYLGPSLPPKEIVWAARRAGAKAVVLQTTDPAIPASQQIPAIRRGLPDTVELWLGGGSLSHHPGVILLKDFDDLNRHHRRLAVV